MCWVSESMWPFSIISDWGSQCLMKTGQPEYYIPSTSTISCDVKEVFMKVWSRIAKMLQVRIWVSNITRLIYPIQKHNGTLSFGTDAWISPNHKAYVTVTVHFEQNRKPMCLTEIIHDKFVWAYADLSVDEVVIICTKTVHVTHPMSPFSFEAPQAEHILWSTIHLCPHHFQAQGWAQMVPWVSCWECQGCIWVVGQELNSLPPSLSGGIHLLTCQYQVHVPSLSITAYPI